MSNRFGLDESRAALAGVELGDTLSVRLDKFNTDVNVPNPTIDEAVKAWGMETVVALFQRGIKASAGGRIKFAVSAAVRKGTDPIEAAKKAAQDYNPVRAAASPKLTGLSREALILEDQGMTPDQKLEALRKLNEEKRQTILAAAAKRKSAKSATAQ